MSAVLPRTFVAQRLVEALGTPSQQERMAAGVLPQEEFFTEVLRPWAFRCFDGAKKLKSIAASKYECDPGRFRVFEEDTPPALTAEGFESFKSLQNMNVATEEFHGLRVTRTLTLVTKRVVEFNVQKSRDLDRVPAVLVTVTFEDPYKRSEPLVLTRRLAL